VKHISSGFYDLGFRQAGEGHCDESLLLLDKHVQILAGSQVNPIGVGFASG
jgi:hypothetical protein